MATEKNGQVNPPLPRWVVFGAPGVALLLFIIAAGTYVNTFGGKLSPDPGRWGQFGDYIGGVLNPVFGFLSLVAILSTLVLQSRELSLSTMELAKSADALRKQNEALLQQNFENTFFQLLRRFNDLVSATHFGTKSGQEAFRVLYKEELLTTFRQFKGDSGSQAPIDAYAAFYDEKRHLIGQYFRTLYHIFRFIDSSHLSEYDKTVYANIARAQLSTYELCLLFYNGLYEEGREGFKPLIERYGILKHVNPRDLLRVNDKMNPDYYEPEAFLGREERAKRKKSVSGEGVAGLAEQG